MSGCCTTQARLLDAPQSVGMHTKLWHPLPELNA